MKALCLALLLAAPPASAAGHDAVLARAAEVYAPVFAARGLKLEFVEDRQGIMSARADITADGRAVVGVDAGVRANPLLSEDGFRFMVCHEIAHLLGEPPRRPPPPEYDGPVGTDGLTLFSAEGQADYAAAACLRRLLDGGNHADDARPAFPYTASRCAARFSDAADAALCRRVAMAGWDFIRAMTIQVPIAFDTPSQEAVARTLDEIYPTRQCRLDTVLAGALEAPRPACWYRD